MSTSTDTGDIAAFDLAGCGSDRCDPLVTVSAGSAVTGGPIVHDGRLIAGTSDGRVVAFGLGRAGVTGTVGGVALASRSHDVRGAGVDQGA